MLKASEMFFVLFVGVKVSNERFEDVHDYDGARLKFVLLSPYYIFYNMG